MKLCKECGKVIPAIRLMVLPDTETCVSCSEEEPITATQEDLDGINEDAMNIVMGGGK